MHIYVILEEISKVEEERKAHTKSQIHKGNITIGKVDIDSNTDVKPLVMSKVNLTPQATHQMVGGKKGYKQIISSIFYPA